MTNLQRIRKERGLSQSQLANKSGISVRTLQEYEQQHRRVNGMSIDMALKLSLALGCKIIDLMDKE